MDQQRQAIDDASALPVRRAWLVVLGIAMLSYALLQLGSLGHPLLWQDEGETAMFGRRILDHGYPKVHGAEGVVYGMGVPLEVAVDPDDDAYLGSLWGQYYLAAVGVAWSGAVEDVYARTVRVRLPFVLTGMLGLVALLLSVRRALAARSGSALPAAAAFVMLLCLATSLQLHLREARYYAPMVGGVGLAVAFWRALERSMGHRVREAGLSFGLASTIVVLQNVFYPAAVSVMVWGGIEALLGAWRRRRAGGPVRRPLLIQGAPIAVAAGAGVLLALRFDVVAMSQVFSDRWAFGPAGYLANLGHLAAFLLRYELLGLVVLAEIALWRARPAASGEEPARRAAGALLRLAGVLAAVGAGNPIFFERYFIALSPILALVLVLDGEALLARVAADDAAVLPANARRLALGALAVGLALTVYARQEELLGRVAEIVTPPDGPIDRVVNVLREEREDPSRLLIATNYEAEPLMFYLGSRVIGRFHASDREAIRAERAESPDIVIPRTGHPRRLREVRRYLLAGGYASRTLDVADTPYNSIPELYAGRVLERTHWFVTPRPGNEDPPLVLYERHGH